MPAKLRCVKLQKSNGQLSGIKSYKRNNRLWATLIWE